jgi:transcriptional regulator with XRE-family HTH domain
MQPADLQARFAARFGALLEEKGITIGALAGYTGYDRTWLWSLKAGRSAPSLAAMALIAEALEVDPTDLLVTPHATVRHTIQELSRHATIEFNVEIKAAYERELKVAKRKRAQARR